MAFEGLDLPIGKETPKYITLEVNKLEDIIINSINKVYGSHIGYITKQLKEALIENNIIKDENSFDIPQFLKVEMTQEDIDKFLIEFRKQPTGIFRTETGLFNTKTSNHEIFEIKDNEAFLGYTNSNGNFDFVQIPINLKADNNDTK